jgi:hypothetical protein
MTNNRQFHHGAHMLVGALRKTYGPNFAKGCADNERLEDYLAHYYNRRGQLLGQAGRRLDSLEFNSY